MLLTVRGNKYKHKARIGMITFLLAFLLFSCNEKKEERKIERSFYYWKSVFKLTDFERQRLDSLDIKTIYIKFFDVDWDGRNSVPVPKAKLQATREKLQGTVNIIPTVFITNECIQKIDSSQLQPLAENINKLINDISASNNFSPATEIQIDCDWTVATKEKYFTLLKNLKQQTTNRKISATIRLHQIKFITKTGVPPVDRGLLMCYNMGNLKNPATKNSIIETDELKKYIGNLSTYPLPLDLGLPLFSWMVLYRNGIYTGLIENLPGNIFTDAVALQKGNRFEILKDTLLAGYDLKKGDVLRDEQSEYAEILSAAGEVSKQLKNTTLRVSLYHMDSVILKKYTLHELETIYNSMR